MHGVPHTNVSRCAARLAFLRACTFMALASVAFGGVGCRSWFRSTSRSIAQDVDDLLKERGDPTIRHLVGTAGAALRDSVLNGATQASLVRIVDALAADVTERSEVLRDSLLSSEVVDFVARLRSTVLGDSTHAYLLQIRDDFIGPDAQHLISTLRDSLLDEKTRRYAMTLRDDLLGPHTQRAVEILAGAMVDRGVDKFVERYKGSVRPLLNEEVSTVRRFAWQIVAAVAALGAAGIYFVWRQRTKYRRLVEVMTLQIDKIPNTAAYDELTHRIQRRAQARGVEPALRRVLVDQGL